ncbi:MAG: polysaccharide deacetylase family protein, partial [Luteimonas sp.]
MAVAETQLHRVPRHPHAWWWALTFSQAAVVLVWWYWSWRIGLPLMAVTHLAFWWGVLWPQSRLYSPVLVRLPI